MNTLRRLCTRLIAVILLLPVSAAVAQQPCAELPVCDAALGLPKTTLDTYPEPNVFPLPIDDSVLYDRIYRTIKGGSSIHDAPGGNVIEALGPGFSYVTINRFEGDWAEIDAGKWVPNTALTEDVLISRFAGVKLPDDPLPYPTAWVMRHLRASEQPGGDASENNPFMYRYTLVTLYTFVELDGKRWYQIGENQWVHQFDVAKIAPITRPAEVDTVKWVSVDLYEQTLVAYEGEKAVFSTLVSSGLEKWPTNEGLFHVYLRFPRTTMSGAYQQEDFYFLQEVPWTMYFDDDIALHGTYWHDGFGYRHSHGCVNLSITDARWLYDWSADETDYSVPNDPGMAVYVFSSGQYD